MRDKLKRREDILKAARTVFATSGYMGAKVEDIAALAKVAKGTFYLYFTDKRSLFEELLNRVMLQLQATILTVDTRADVAAQVKHNIRAIVALFLDDPTLIALLLGPRGAVDPEMHRRVEGFFHKVKEMLRMSLGVGQQLGIVADGDPELYASFAFGALKEMLITATARDVTREELVGVLFNTMCVGFLRTD